MGQCSVCITARFRRTAFQSIDNVIAYLLPLLRLSIWFNLLEAVAMLTQGWRKHWVLVWAVGFIMPTTRQSSSYLGVFGTVLATGPSLRIAKLSALYHHSSTMVVCVRAWNLQSDASFDSYQTQAKLYIWRSAGGGANTDAYICRLFC